MSSTYARVANLPLTIERWTLEDRSVQVGDFLRRVTILHAHGEGQEGVGEDVAYVPEDHDDLQAGLVPLPVGNLTLDAAAASIRDQDLYPNPPAFAAAVDYRRWAIESAMLDLALRQSGLGLADALGRSPAPVRFVSSMGLGHPPSLDPIRRRLAIDPALRFKLDPAPDWDDALVAELVALGVVDTIDMKGQYGDVDGPLTPPATSDYGRLAGAFPEAWIEDPLLDDIALAALAADHHRITWDAPIHSVADIEGLAFPPRMVNVKPSRFGAIRRLFDCYDWLDANGVGAYGGGQWELGPGRGQIQALAALFHQGGPNDIAPVGWNAAEPVAPLPTTPLAPALLPVGFGWEPSPGL